MNKKRGRKPKSNQYKFRRTTFAFNQYWIIYYTESYSDNTEKDFAVFIKAKSYELAKIILKERVKEDDRSIKLKALNGYMLHKDYKNRSNQRHLSMTDWDSIRSTAFPNLQNILLKKYIPRPEGYTNKFNKCTGANLKGKGFKKGEENWSRQNRKGIFLSIEDRKGKRWTGAKWVSWSKEEMQHFKNRIINALILHNNNRSKAAKHLGIGRNSLYKNMLRCESRSWWTKKYPPAKPVPPRVSSEQRSQTQKEVMLQRKIEGEKFFQRDESIEAKRLKNLKLAKTKERDKYRESLVPVIKAALENNNNNRSKAADSLNVKRGTFKAWMQRTKAWVDWSKEYPKKV
jgi:DNA-binding protein Fis